MSAAGRDARPPALALWLLSHRVPAAWRDFVLGDLEEEFRDRSAVSPAAARRWFWRQTIRCLAAPPPAPASTGPRRKGDSIVRMLLGDIRLAFRVLVRTPVFALTAILVLALGIGANTAIFSLVNSVLLRPLPFDEPEGLVRIYHVPPQSTFPGMPVFAVSPANFYDWQKDATSFEAMAMFRLREFALTGQGDASSIVAAQVMPEFFQILRAQPLLGRTFTREDDEPGRGQVVILSYQSWQTRFGGRADVIGQTLTLNDQAYPIVGVMPARFTMRAFAPTAQNIFMPLAMPQAERAVRENHNLRVVGRLAPGVDVAGARAELQGIATRLEAAYPRENAGWGATVISLQDDIVGDSRLSLWILLGAVSLVLLIACANVGNLLLARTLTRRKELAIRAALGAGRARVFQQLVIEAIVLAGAGGLAGVLLASALLRAAAVTLAGQLPRADELTIDTTVLLFVAGVSILTGVLAGALPALRAGQSDLTGALREGGRQDAVVGIRTRRALVVCEVALSVVLLMGAAVLLRSLIALGEVDTGFRAEHVLTLRVSLPQRYSTPASVRAFYDTALQRLRALPGVEGAGAIDALPMQGGSVQPVVVEGKPELLPRDQPTVRVRIITPGYLDAMKIPVLRGRDVRDGDTAVVLISRSAATLLWGSDDPLDRRLMMPLQSRTKYSSVVGIVGDVKQGDLSEPMSPTLYQFASDVNVGRMTFALRTSTPPVTLMTSATNVIRDIDPQQPVDAVRTLQSMLDDSLRARRVNASLLVAFAALAVALATVGIYSVLAYLVRGRRREIGIRIALGARNGDVLRLFVLEGMKPAVIGIVIGSVAALASATLLDRMAYGVSASDPLSLVLVVIALGLVALLASFVPAWRATRLPPLHVLRE